MHKLDPHEQRLQTKKIEAYNQSHAQNYSNSYKSHSNRYKKYQFLFKVFAHRSMLTYFSKAMKPMTRTAQFLPKKPTNCVLKASKT